MVSSGTTTYPVPPSENDASWNSVRHFLSHFHGSIFCYIPDAESLKNLPVTHSDVLDIDKQAQGYGLFYSVNGFKSINQRTEANLLCLNAFYVDIDWPKERLGIPKLEDLATFKRDALQALSEAAVDGFAPTHIIETKNGLHALWCLNEPVILDNLPIDTQVKALTSYQKIQLAIIDRFQGDSQAKDVTRVLRLPNTWHLKNPATPFRVRFADSDQHDCQTYVFKQIKDYFLRTEVGSREDVDGENETAAYSALIWQRTKNREPLNPAIFDELRARYPKMDRPSVQALMQKDGIGEGRRNHSLLIAASAMRESGQTEMDVLGYFDHYNGLGAYEIAHTVKSAFKSPTPLSFGWNHPMIAPHVTTEEKSRVATILGGILKRDRKHRQALEKAQEFVPIISELPPEQKEAVIASTELAKARRSAAEEKAFQKNLYNNYEAAICERYPRLRYCLANSLFYDFVQGVYLPLSTEMVRALILQEMLSDNLLDYRTETGVKNKILCLKSLERIQIKPCDMDPNPNILNLENGLVDFSTGDLKPHTPDYFSTNRIPVRLRTGTPEELAPRWCQFVDEIMRGDLDKIRFLRQMAGYCFTRSVEHQKAFILYGTGANGKSTFIDTLMKILGEPNVSSLTLSALHERFGGFKLFNKTMNVVEEISDNFFESDMIKKIITGSEITTDRKFMEPLIFRPFAKFVFAVNTLPKIKDTSMGLYRRFYIIDFLANFEVTGETDLAEKLWNERDGVFLWCMEGWQDLLQNRGFFVPASVSEATERFKENNSPLVEFILRHYEIVGKERAASFSIPLMQVFEAYQTDVKALGYQPKNFSNIVKELTNLSHGSLRSIAVTSSNNQQFVTGIMLKKVVLIQPLTPSFIQP